MTRTPATAPDHVDLTSAVVGPDLVLSRKGGGAIALYTIDGTEVHEIGTFGDPATAWAALDAHDLQA
ncbi:MAG TPA: hypothetical protein VD931_00925 [Baekduia sp.]|nr:hypothetical protein [Baekduia sp.]